MPTVPPVPLVPGLCYVLGIMCLLLGILLATLTAIPVVPTPTPVPSATVTVTTTPVAYVFFDTYTEPGTGQVAFTSHIPEVGNAGGPYSLYNVLDSLDVISGAGYGTSTKSTNIGFPYCGNQGSFVMNTTKGLECKMTVYVPPMTVAPGNLAVCGYLIMNSLGNGYAVLLGVDPNTPDYSLTLANYTGFAIDGAPETQTVSSGITQNAELFLTMTIPNVVDASHPVTASIEAASGTIALTLTTGMYSPATVSPAFGDFLVQCGRQDPASDSVSIQMYEMSVIEV